MITVSIFQAIYMKYTNKQSFPIYGTVDEDIVELLTQTQIK